MSRHLHKIQLVLVGATRRPIDFPSSNGDQHSDKSTCLVIRSLSPNMAEPSGFGNTMALSRAPTGSGIQVARVSKPFQKIIRRGTLTPAQNTLSVGTLFLFGCAVIVHRVRAWLGNRLAFLAGNQSNGSERPFVTLQRWFQA